MARGRNSESKLINIEVFIGGAPLLELRLVEGLLKFGQSHPHWRFSMRSADFRYSRAWLKEQQVAGVLALIEAKPVVRPLNAAGIPWIHLLPPYPVSHPYVNADDYSIGRLGAELFLERGFLRCAFCGVGTYWSNNRATGFRECLAEADRACKFIDIPFETSASWGLVSGAEQRLQKWVAGLDRGIAVMAAHDVLANRLVDLCLRQRLRIPQDIAVLGVGNHDLLCKLSPVPISSIDAAVPHVAIQGANMLEKMIKDKRPPAPILVPPGGVSERQSTEILNYGDDLVAKIVTYIRDHVCDGVTVEDLLKIFPISRRTLTRRFAKYVGHSPAAEIRHHRLRHAQELITKTSLPFTEIATTCGYADLSHMDRVFHHTLENSPSELRRSRYT